MASASLNTNNVRHSVSRSRAIGNDDTKLRKTSTIRRQPLKPKLAGSITADQLVTELVSKLTLNDVKGKRKAEEPIVDTKLSSMRAVNAASQSLGAVVQSGWKKSNASSASRTTLTTIKNSASSAENHLSILRKLTPGNVDVERAAVSVLGKLVSLEMFDISAKFLAEIHPRVCSLVNATNDNSLQLGIPQVATPPTDPVILTLVSTYLVYAIIIKAQVTSFEQFALSLSSPYTHSLLQWLSAFSVLPSKHIDSLLTRTYSTLNKLSSTASSSSIATSKLKSHTDTTASPESLFTLRMYGLHCLAYTSPGIIEAGTFWDQCSKLATVLVGSTPPALEERITRLLLTAFGEVIRIVEKRQDRDAYLSTVENGKSFVTFCEHWSSYAKRAGDITVLQQINSFIQPAFSSPQSSSPSPHPPNQHQDIIVEGTRIYNAFGQISVLLENITQAENHDALRGSLRDITQFLKTSSFIPALLQPIIKSLEKRSREEEEVIRMRSRIDRVLEKARRSALKVLETSTPTSPTSILATGLKSDLRDFLLQSVILLESFPALLACSAPSTRDILTRCLDTLFVLSRTLLDPRNPTTFAPAFDLLSKAATILQSVPTNKFPLLPMEETVDLANFTRCISGAFYNIAGALYQATRYGNAVPFLIESCSLGQKALRIPCPQPPVANESREKEWAQLREQLYRRWELLAACYSKNGDRKKAYDCFKRAIHSFPFESSGLLSQCDRLPLDIVFGPSGSSSVALLSGLVDRLSYLGTCDLLLNPEEVSIISAVVSIPGTAPTTLEPSVAGALLEHQLNSLHSSRSKDGVREVIIRLLQDVLAVYREAMPVRRARVLIRCMDFLYRDPVADSCKLLGFNDVEEMARQVEELASLESIGKDAQLAHFIPQYRIMAHLWLALHAHRRADPNQTSILAQRTEAACRIMKDLVTSASDSTSQKAARKALSPKVIAKAMSPKVAKLSKLVSPRQTRAIRLRTPAAPKKAAPIAKTRTRAKVNPDPVTPKAPSQIALPPVTFSAVQTPPRQSTGRTQGNKSALLFDEFDTFLSLLQITSRILGMFGLILPKAHLLEMTRKLSQRQMGSTSDGYVIASLDLAHEYASLGKLRRAASIFNQALDIVRSGQTSGDVAVRFLLRFAESLALIEDVPKSSKIYIEALELSNKLNLEQNAKSTVQRIHARASVLEIAATATYVFALVQYAKGEIYTSMEGFLQSLRLWNRAIDTLSRLNPSTKTSSGESDPFQMTTLKDALPSAGPEQQTKKMSDRRSPSEGLEWRISEGLFSAMLSLSQAYFQRGSGREAEYFARQATELAEQLNTPAMLSRALAKQGKTQLHMGLMDEARANLTKAAEVLSEQQSVDTAEIQSIFVELKTRMTEQEPDDDSQRLLNETVTILEELDGAFHQFDKLALEPRRSLGTSPRMVDGLEVLAPEVLCSILCQQLWAMRDEPGDSFNNVLQKLVSLSNSNITKAEENAIMAKLTLHGVYDRFRTDMFLSSLTESTIAVPIGMGSKEDIRTIHSSIEVIDALSNAERLLWEQLHMISINGNVVRIRDAAISLVLVNAFRTSLGDRRAEGPSVMVRLLDIAAALTLRRDMLEAIEHKTLRQAPDDLQWPILSEDGECLPSPSTSNVDKGRRFALAPQSDSEDEDSNAKADALKNYWNSVRTKYKGQLLTSSVLAKSETTELPDNWTIINISITPDKATLFISRQESGPDSPEPLVFCIPLKGRRDHGSGEDEENHLTFDAATEEFRDIVRSSDECTKSAITIKADDDEARSNWWKQRGALDVRMRELLENIEYCWLGAFKTILSPASDMSPESISELKSQIERVFHRALNVKGKKSRAKSSGHKKSTSQYQTNAPTQFAFDDSIIRCFSTLSPKCRDEELEDFIYFVLDLYQFHGVPVAIAELDIDQVVIDLRTVLEEHRGKEVKQQMGPNTPLRAKDEHLFLILDKNVQGLPWESIPILRGRSVSRIPGVQFLYDRLEFAKMKREAKGKVHIPEEGAVVDPSNGYYILNPSGDLGRTEERFRNWADAMKRLGWGGVSGKQVSEQQFVDALETRDLVVYFGHGGGEQYVRSHKIRSLPTCAATMLWGCSSGNLRDMGDFDRTGTPYNYMLGGCPTLVANLWDVTDKDIDKLSQSVFNKLGLTIKDHNQQRDQPPRNPTSLVAAVAQSRDSCKLKYLTGAAPVVYGIPFYL